MQNPTPEQLIAQWDEPPPTVTPLPLRSRLVIIGAAVILIAAFIGLGYWQKQFSYYLAAGVVAAAALALINQNGRALPSLTVVVTTTRIQVGRHEYALSDLAGFWLQPDDGRLMVILEYKKPALIPVSFAFQTASESDARTLLTYVLPELEARTPGPAESLSRYFRF